MSVEKIYPRSCKILSDRDIPQKGPGFYRITRHISILGVQKVDVIEISLLLIGRSVQKSNYYLDPSRSYYVTLCRVMVNFFNGWILEVFTITRGAT